MKKLLIFWLLSLPVLAQMPRTITFSGYRGNSINQTVDLLPTDTLLSITARATYNSLPTSLPISPQPTLSRSGLKLTIQFYPTLNLPLSSWVEVSIGGAVRFAGQLIPDKTTNSSPAPAPAPAQPIVVPGSTSVVYTLSNAPPGHTINHSKSNRLVKASFFREDTGQIDPLWRIQIINDNTVSTIGPPTETFSGKIVLDFTNQITN